MSTVNANLYLSSGEAEYIQLGSVNPDKIVHDKFVTNGYVKHGVGWRDNVSLFSASRGNGTTEPVWKDSGNGNFDMHFTDGDELFTKYHVNHDYALGTKAYPHIHFYSDSLEAAGNVVNWTFTYVIAKGHQQGDSVTAPRTVINMPYTYTGNEIAGEHIILECADIEAFELIEPDTIISAEVMMTSSTAAGRVFGIMADLHYQSNGRVTISKVPDFYQ